MKPTIPLTDPRFVYTPAHATDIRVRFNRERARLKQQQTHLAIFRQRREGKA